MKKKSVIVIPVYRNSLTELERYSLNYSLEVLKGKEIFFIGPKNIDRDFIKSYNIQFFPFDSSWFSSISGYNRLLLSKQFYENWIGFDFVLVLQTDAIVLRDDLDFWCEQPFDYIGAPWPEGYELFVNLGRFDGQKGKRVRATVGNGGLSLRRVKKCIALLEEFPEAVWVFHQTGSSEDLFFSVMGELSNDFIIPNEITASRFSLELNPSYYYAVNGNSLPMGGHAWWKYEPEFWYPYLRKPLPFKI
ncbi:MAG: hypothetical protein N3D16_05665 [Anaerolineales bacterium]|nr:hypothetical protein [Anaerolineales bacterium]